MAFPAFVPAVDQIIVAAALNGTTAASAVAVGHKKRILIGATGGISVLFGDSTVGAPSATSGTIIPAAGVYLFDMHHNDYVRVYNLTGSAINYSVSTVFD